MEHTTISLEKFFQMKRERIILKNWLDKHAADQKAYIVKLAIKLLDRFVDPSQQKFVNVNNSTRFIAYEDFNFFYSSHMLRLIRLKAWNSYSLLKEYKLKWN